MASPTRESEVDGGTINTIEATKTELSKQINAKRLSQILNNLRLSMRLEALLVTQQLSKK